MKPYKVIMAIKYKRDSVIYTGRSTGLLEAIKHAIDYAEVYTGQRVDEILHAVEITEIRYFELSTKEL